MKRIALVLIAVLLGWFLYKMFSSPGEVIESDEYTGRSTAGSQLKLDAPEDDLSPDSDEDRGKRSPYITITMVYSGEKDRWIREAASSFAKTTGNEFYQVELVEQSSFTSARGILKGKIYPDVWSPASSFVVRWFVTEWEYRSRTNASMGEVPLILDDGHGDSEDGDSEDGDSEDGDSDDGDSDDGDSDDGDSDDGDGGALKPLVRSPLVLVSWQADLKDLRVKDTSWQARSLRVQELFKAPELTGLALKIGHTDPVRSNSGMQAFYLLALTYFSGKTKLTREQILDIGLQNYLRQWGGYTSNAPASTTQLTTDMFRFGPSRYNMIVTYENLALERRRQSRKAQGPFGELIIGYPRGVLWADHPAVMLRPKRDSAYAREKQKVARKWIEFLRDRKMQESAVKYGFRPVNIDFDVNDPESILYRVPLAKELNILEPPDGDVVWELTNLWHSFQDG